PITPVIYTLSLHDALPISVDARPVVQQRAHARRRRRGHGADEDRVDRCRGPAPERGERPLPGDPIRGELPRALEAAERALGPCVEVAIDGHELAASSEQELQDGNVPAKPPAPQCPAPEERAAER